jgi:hypothetical protein
MKRALTAALFSGLFVFAAPQLAFADHAAGHDGDCGAKTEKTAEPDQHQAPEHPYGDSEQHDGNGDGGEVLF